MPSEFPILQPLRCIIFDLDGTLVDSNSLQVDAWLATLRDHDFRVSRDRIEGEIGKGGDQLVRDVFGQGIENEKGDALRQSQSEHAKQQIVAGVNAFPGVIELLRNCRSRGLQIALATSSSQAVQQLLLDAAGIQPSLFDVRITADDAAKGKPDADIYRATLAKLKVGPGECVSVGDTPYDVRAARKAGVLTIGISGGLNSAETLRESGARVTVKDAGELNARLDELIRTVNPHPSRLSAGRLDVWMQHALAVAERGLAAGEAPIAALVIRGDGEIIGQAFNRMRSTGDKIAHAEIEALHAAAGRVDPAAKDCVLVSTLEPCVMCMGAAIEAGIDTVVFGLSAPSDGGSMRVTPPLSPESQMPRLIGGVCAEASRALLKRWFDLNRDLPQARYVGQLLQLTK